MMLAELLKGSPYGGYSYSYPHKTAYRALEPAVRLDDVWEWERKDALFLYLHVPFCEMRCGFCNLFTTTNRSANLEAAYIEALRRQARAARDALWQPSFSRLAIGGGTPTFLSAANLNALFDTVEDVFETSAHAVPASVETSPATATAEKLGILRERGVSRVSIGVQSFVEAEANAAGRPQTTAALLEALERIKAAGFPVFNIDLMYGLPGQTVESWLGSLKTALEFGPEEIYLYPLYVRALTGLGKRGVPEGDLRVEKYRAGRDFLLGSGYRQVSMRMFQKIGLPEAGPVYCCQEDGMVGIGCGARSYTSTLHYSGSYAVGAQGVREIIDDYIKMDGDDFEWANYGFRLDEREQRRRYVIQSILQAEGLDLERYQGWFGWSALEDIPSLAELEELGLGEITDGHLRLNAEGLRWSDVIGPWLESPAVRERMVGYELR